MTKTCALLLIDVQSGFDDPYWGNRNNPQAELNIEQLLKAFRAAKLPIIHVMHHSQSLESPLHPSKPGIKLMDFAKPEFGELMFTKNVNSAFIGTKLEDELREMKIQTLFIAGISTDHCISTSTRMASNLGFKTYVVADATFTFDRHGFDGEHYSAHIVHAVALASLHDEFATVINTEAAIELIEKAYESERFN